MAQAIWKDGLKRLSQVYEHMHETRVRRLVQTGFDKDTATKVSELHSSAVKSFMCLACV